MDKEEAFDLAVKIAKLLVAGSKKLANLSLNEQTLFGSLSAQVAIRAKDSLALDPNIKEIVLFGSCVSKESGIIGDVDLMVFDQGFYSNLLCGEPKDKNGFKIDKYNNLRGNLRRLARDWFEFIPTTFGWTSFEEPPVDLHVLPLALFTDPDRQREIALQHFDPLFFEKAFSKIMRYDFETQGFVETELAYFEQKYPCKLSESWA